jgi:fatty-acid desaturase
MKNTNNAEKVQKFTVNKTNDWTTQRTTENMFLRRIYPDIICLLAYSGAKHIMWCVFVLIFFVLCTVSLDCPFLIAPFGIL